MTEQRGQKTPEKKSEKKKKARPPSTKRRYSPEDGLCRKVRNFARSCGGDYFSVPGAASPTPRALNVQTRESARREDEKRNAQYAQGRAKTRARKARRDRNGQSARRRERRAVNA